MPFKPRKEQIMERSREMREYLDDTPVEIPPAMRGQPQSMEDLIKAAVAEQLGSVIDGHDMDTPDDEEDYEDYEEPVLSDYQIDVMAVEAVRGYQYEDEQPNLAPQQQPAEPVEEVSEANSNEVPPNEATPLDSST